MSKLRPQVAIFSLAYDPFVGGAEIAVKEIVRRLPDTDFAILTRKFDQGWPPIESSENYSVIRFGRGRTNRKYYGGFWGKISYIFSAYRWAIRAHKANPFSAVWAVMASYAGIAALFFKLRHPEVPLLLTLQEGDSEAHILSRVGIFYPLWRLIFKKADRIQVISRYLKDFAIRHGAVCPIWINPNGVDLTTYEINRSGYQAGSVFKVITTSRLVKKNGIDILIRAIAEISNPNIELRILGSGPEEAVLKKLALILGVSDKIEFSGSVDPDLIPEYLNKADLFVRPSRSEGLGNSFLEAMAAGLPVIGTNVGGIPDFLTDEVTGLFAKVEDAKDLAGKIIKLKEDKDLREKIARNGRRMVQEEYSWDIVAGKMKLLFKELCGF